jgi:hypothetical protein
MLRDLLIPSLRSFFPAEHFRFHDGENKIASLPMPNGEGELLICDDGDEVTIFLGGITHCHFSQEYLGSGEYSPEGEVVQDVIDYLKDLFADRLVFYHAPNHHGDGSIQRPSAQQLEAIPDEWHCFVWTRPLNRQTPNKSVEATAISRQVESEFCAPPPHL